MLTGLAPDMTWPRPVLVGLLALPAAVIWAMAVWQGETPTRRATHWSLPVSRPLSDAARVLAGAVLLLAAYAALVAIDAVWALLDGSIDVWTLVDREVWLGYFVAPLVVYLYAMPLVLWSEYRITKWFVGLLLLCPPTLMLLEAQGITRPMAGFVNVMVSGDLSMASAVFDPMLGEADANWWLAALVWLAFGAAFTAFTATYRPDDLRRLVRQA